MKNYADRGGRYLPITPSEICIILYIIRKLNSIIIIVVLFTQNISRALRKTKFTLLSSVTNNLQSLQHTTIFAVNFN